jgi:hypothetical protein
MPLTLITGTPGAGKTLSALEWLCKEMKVDATGSAEQVESDITFQSSAHVVVVGVEGIREDLFQVETDPYGWQDYPDGTIFLIDEAWKWFGSHNQDVKKDPRVLSLAEHRHRGMKFVLTSQYPMQLIPHVRALVDEHIHVRRKFGSEVTIRTSWPHLQESPNNPSAQQSGQAKTWKYPQALFSLYKSATVHNIKRRIPFKVWALPVAAILTLGLFAGGFFLFSSFGDAKAEPDYRAPVSGQGPDSGATRTIRTDSVPSDLDPAITWLARQIPRVRGLPQSAPIYDEFEAERVPRVFCIASGPVSQPTRCRCMTEQATRVDVSLELCTAIATDGLYDPYQRRERERERDPESRE